jgi:hypothetical protein
VSIFIDNIFKLVIDFFDKYDFIKDFSFLVTIFLVPAIYLIGHIIGSLNYNLLQLYVWLDKRKFFKREMPKWKYLILIKLQQLLYRQRVVYAITTYTKSDKTEKLYKSVGEFWIICAKLQIEKIYAPAEYWYILNELFNSINLIFFISSIISFIYGQWIFGTVYIILTIFAYKRARQYADHFIQTICNLTISKETT